MRISVLTTVPLISLLYLMVSCHEVKPSPEWAELSPVFEQHNLIASGPPQRYREVADIEETDSRLYAPVAGVTIFLQAPSPVKDSEGLKPRYWLRVEDFATAELAGQRAAEYVMPGAYERIAKAHGRGSSHMFSKLSVRMWAIARGKRVYALTTDTYLFTLIELPKNLRGSISALPET